VGSNAGEMMEFNDIKSLQLLYQIYILGVTCRFEHGITPFDQRSNSVQTVHIEFGVHHSLLATLASGNSTTNSNISRSQVATKPEHESRAENAKRTHQVVWAE
jgi:hypothetical protein